VPPLSDLEANLVKSPGNIDGSIPVPVSMTETIATLSGSFLSCEITISEPSSVNLMALPRRLDKTCDSLPLSPSIMISSFGVNIIFLLLCFLSVYN